ncbi:MULTISPECIES: LysR family transcriptional regulator [unclassified Crossiella]|uniref:LysR family transcriptional regulator n=1 Tax=unclassified Crossiella TaxID=2620835 RepID=UPI001FFF7FE1|nr:MULTISPECIES: LysR family transcriptional regulator [unclassified Crossiella]MCK2239108.1 LysR family transcriptional regulator [Crossiella sp. S99.2]MCK2251323.1 LysR family transcriptional regulator [Crossiella sp. S99.1]
MELDLGAVRAFVAIADEQHFGAAADQLGLTQQAVSKRIAKLEAGLGTALLHRGRTGTGLTEDGAAFLPPARALLALADQAVTAVRRRDRPLRVDVLGARLAPTELIREFHEANPDVEIDIVAAKGLRTGVSALLDGTVDVAFARIAGPLDPAIEHTPALLEPFHFLAGRKHRLATRRKVRPVELADSIAWMPGNEPGSEWADYYEAYRADFGLTIDPSGPSFGLEHMLDRLATDPDRFMFGSERMRVPWHPGIARIPVVHPIPLYPWSVLWRRSNRHPVLPRLIEHLSAGFRPFDPDRQWLPAADLRVLRGG